MKDRNQRSIMEWTEPSTQNPTPSFEEHGFARHGVFEQMAPLGQPPSAKVKQRTRRRLATSDWPTSIQGHAFSLPKADPEHDALCSGPASASKLFWRHILYSISFKHCYCCLDWSFAGRSPSGVAKESPHAVLGAYRHTVWEHWVDSRVPVGLTFVDLRYLNPLSVTQPLGPNPGDLGRREQVPCFFNNHILPSLLESILLPFNAYRSRTAASH